MRQVILQEFVSIDGLAAGPKGSVDFIPVATQNDASLDRHQLQLTDSVDLILLGRVTYEMFAGYWPNQTKDDDPAADVLNKTPKLVFSRTIRRAPWGKYAEARVERRDAAETVAKLKKAQGKDMILWGSLSVARSLAKAGLIDRYELIVCPVVLGDGTPLFGHEASGRELKLKEATAFDRGGVALAYVP